MTLFHRICVGVHYPVMWYAIYVLLLLVSPAFWGEPVTPGDPEPTIPTGFTSIATGSRSAVGATVNGTNVRTTP